MSVAPINVAPVPPRLTAAGPFLRHHLGRRGGRYALLLGLVVAAAACAVGVQYGVKLLVDAMTAQDRARAPSVWAPLALFMGLIAVENLCWRLAGWHGFRTIVATAADLRLDLFAYLAGHPVRYFADHFSGALGNRITATGTSFVTLGTTVTWAVVPPLVDFLGALVLFAGLDRRMAGALAVFALAVAAGLLWYGRRGRPAHEAFAREAGAVGGELVDALGNIWAVKAFSARRRERERLAAKLAGEAAAHGRSLLFLERLRALHDVTLWLLAGAMLVWAIQLWQAGRITPGEVVLVSALTFRILHGSREMALALINSTQHLNQIAETLRLIGRPRAVADRPQAVPFRPLGGSIAFQRVSFGYQHGGRVLDDFSLQIPPGQKVGIVGPSGAGKSTLLHLLQRLEDVAGGRVLVDGQDVAAVAQDSLRAAIAVVPQEISLFHRSLLENIRYGRPEADAAEVMAAARAAHCHDFILSLPQGYATLVGERGVKLSGGQRQRIGLARAILKDAPIVLLDEATSALDTGSEIEIRHALASLTRGRTVLAVAHRLSTVAEFDRVVVLERGRVVEDGHPGELRRRGGAFDRLWRLQAEGLDAGGGRTAAPRPPRRAVGA